MRAQKLAERGVGRTMGGEEAELGRVPGRTHSRGEDHGFNSRLEVDEKGSGHRYGVHDRRQSELKIGTDYRPLEQKGEERRRASKFSDSVDFPLVEQKEFTPEPERRPMLMLDDSRKNEDLVNIDG